MSGPKVVTITLPNGALAGWPVLIDAFRIARDKTGMKLVFGDLIAQIEEQIPPPKPEEPQGLGAVVEDADGETWVRAGSDHEGQLLDNWRLATGGGVGDWQPWSRINAVCVLSEGVRP